MHNEEEVREDFKRLLEHVHSLELKYDEDFSCVLALGVDLDEGQVAGAMSIMGEDKILHQIMHMLLERSARFVDELFDTIGCVLLRSHKDEPDFIKKMVVASVESMKRQVLEQNKQFLKAKMEVDAEEVVTKFLDNFYGRNKEN